MDAAVIRRGLAVLAERDAALAAALRQLGPPPPRIRPHGFRTLLHIIVGQQLSIHAAAAILKRLEQAAPDLGPEAVTALDDATLRAAGLTFRKIGYVRALADALSRGEPDLEVLPRLDDAAVVASLSRLRGFGRWSAEIYALFALGRRDIFPAGDLALREALRRLRGLPERPDEAVARELAADWAPWRGVGALFLWHYHHRMPA